MSGNPPGRWLGSGLSGLGDVASGGVSAGEVVTEEQMARLFGRGGDPVTGAALGRGHRVFAAGAGRKAVAGFDLTFSARKSVSMLWALGDDTIREAVLKAHHAALSSVMAYAESTAVFTRTGRDGIAQVPVRGVIAAAFDHWDSRTGDPQLHTHVVIANKVQGLDGVWRSLDSRALHHAAVTLSELYDNVLADHLTASLGVRWGFRDRGARRCPGFEVEGIDDPLLSAFSTRTAGIDAHYASLAEAFTATHGRAPSGVEVTRLRQQATLATRPAKTVRPLDDLLGGWRERARAAAGREPREITEGALDREPQVLLAHDQVSPATVHRLAAVVLDAVAERRSVFTTWQIRAEVHRATRGLAMATAGDRIAVADRVTAAVQELAVRVTPVDPEPVPMGMTRPDGTSVLTRAGMDEFTHPDLLAAEARLLDTHLHDLDSPAVPRATVRRIAGTAPPARHPGSTGMRELAADQAAAVMTLATSGRRLEVLVGPAGAGKTTTLGVLASAWEQRHGQGSVIGLAPSATAAAELSASLGIGCENTAKWLHESVGDGAARRRRAATALHTQGRAASLEGRLSHAKVCFEQVAALDAESRRWRLGAGQLVIVDEAAMAATVDLDELRAQAVAAGAKLVLVGDHAQLPAVGAGGAFGLLAEAGHRVELSSLWRFTQPWEAEASRGLRIGDPEVIARYADHARISAGDGDQVIDDAYTAWAADTAGGLTSLLIAPDNDTVTALNERAHHDRAAAGAVTGAVIALGSFSSGGQRGHAGVGGLVLTRRNDRRLPLPDGSHVRNGDLWRVTAVHPDGALSVVRTTRAEDAGTMPAPAPGHGAAPDGQLAVRLPAAYVAQYVDPGYASTIHRAQGLTVDTTNVIVAPGMTREALYVAMTRGRDGNRAYVVTGDDTLGSDRQPDLFGDQEAGREVLEGVLANSGAPRSALQAVTAARSPIGTGLGADVEATLELSHALLARRGVHSDDATARPTWLPPDTPAPPERALAPNGGPMAAAVPTGQRAGIAAAAEGGRRRYRAPEVHDPAGCQGPSL